MKARIKSDAQGKKPKGWEIPDQTFNPKYCDSIIAVFKDGNTVAHFCAKHNIARSTFYEWLNNYPEFSIAYEIAQEYAEKYWIDEGKKNLVTQAFGEETIKFNESTYALFMGARFGITKARKLALSGFNKKNPIAAHKRVSLALSRGEITGQEALQLSKVCLDKATLKERLELVPLVEQLMKEVNEIKQNKHS